MRKKRILLTLVGALLSTALWAQSAGDYVLTGWVKDSISGESEAYATIRLKKAGAEKALKVVTTDNEGHFRLNVSGRGSYTLECIVIGKELLRRDFTADSLQAIDFGELRLRDINNTLGTATVTAERPLVKAEIDKLTYSMADDPEAQTNTLLEMLRKVPMVTVDGEDEIKIKGSTGFKVYVNGKPNQMMSSNPSLIFKNYPAATVKKIEVITDPGAKYDAEGVSGILNIITNDNTTTTGYTLTPNFGWSNRGVRGGLFGMAQFGKLTLSAHYMIGHNKNPESTTGRTREAFDDAENHLLQTNGRTFDNEGTWQFGNLEASYEFNAKNLLSLSAGIHAYNGENKGSGENVMLRADGSQQYAYSSLSTGDFKYPSYTLGLDYQHTFDRENRMLTLSYRLQSSPTQNNGLSTYTIPEGVLLPFELTDLSSQQKQTFTEQTGQVDFSTPFGEHHELSVGGKYIHRNNHSDNEEAHRPAGTDEDFVIDPLTSLRYRHLTDIAAGYAEYRLKVGKYTARLGGRYEFSHVHADYPDGSRPAYSRNFSDLVPTVNFGYNLSDLQMLKLSYNLRIGRPDISYLSPYVDRSDPTSISYGNPNLDSEKQHNLGLEYSNFTTKYSVNAALNYSVSNNGMIGYSFLKDGVVHTTFANILHSKTLGLSLFGNWTIVKGTSLNLNASGSYADYRCYATGDHNYGWSGSLFGGINQQLPWRMKLGLWGGGSTKNINLQGSSKGWYFYSANLSRNFLAEDRLSITVSAGDFIKPKRRGYSLVETETFRSEIWWRNDFLRLGVSVRYRLGKLQAVVKKAQRSISNDDVVGSGGAGSAGGNQSGAGGGE